MLGQIFSTLSIPTLITPAGEAQLIKEQEYITTSTEEMPFFTFPQITSLEKFKTITFSLPNRLGTHLMVQARSAGIHLN